MRVGIIGGGQLAQMLCEAASKLGFETVVLDPNSGCSASYVADQMIIAKYDDIEAIEKLARLCDVVTYEFENVDVKAIETINSKYGNVVQGTKPLELANDRLVEKLAARESGFEPAPFEVVNDFTDLDKFVCEYGFPVVLKIRRFGYDGKGQEVLHMEEDFAEENVRLIIESGAIVEKMIDLDYELSVIVIRNPMGDIKFIPSTINTHRENILFTSKINVGDEYPQVTEVVKSYIEYHDLVGIITVEVFVSKDGEIIFNEIAPRPHNSGHYSIEGCDHSQFDMHLRSITGLELPDSKLIDETMMINVLGQDFEMASNFIDNCDIDGIYFHDYYKDEKRHNRKVGHITAVGKEAVNSLEKYEKLIKEHNE